jgi:hypothetical protein
MLPYSGSVSTRHPCRKLHNTVSSGEAAWVVGASERGSWAGLGRGVWAGARGSGAQGAGDRGGRGAVAVATSTAAAATSTAAAAAAVRGPGPCHQTTASGSPSSRCR